MKLERCDEIWCVDFEYHSADGGGLPVPVCMVAREYRTGRLIRLWQDQLRVSSRPPFRTDDRTVYVAYNAAAEFGCHLALGWPLPELTFDPYVEFRALNNGRAKPLGGYGLVGASVFFNCPHITTAEKRDMRDLILTGGPWNLEQQQAILDYCQSDVDALCALLPKYLARAPHYGQLLLRGRYMRAVAHMVHNGVPLDVDTFELLRASWDTLKIKLVEQTDHQGIYDGTTFKYDRFERLLAQQNISWPRLDSGKLDLKSDTFRDMAKVHAILKPIKELRHTLSELKLNALCVGPDGRNRTSLFPFSSVTGRNQPSSAKFIFGPSKWLRSLIKPTPGYGLAYIDYSQQEVGIAAALSNDTSLTTAYVSGDPYITFAVQAKALPRRATRAEHGDVRDQYKQCMLATQYGMGEDSLADRIGKAPIDARHLLGEHRSLYAKYWRWSDAVLNYAQLNGRLQTRYGWSLHITPETKERTIRNFPMQGNGAEMLRLALCYITEAGITVCAPVHDAVLIEAPLAELEEVTELARGYMALASRQILHGLELRTDVDYIRYPARYDDNDGSKMWKTVMQLLPKLCA